LGRDDRVTCTLSDQFSMDTGGHTTRRAAPHAYIPSIRMLLAARYFCPRRNTLFTIDFPASFSLLNIYVHRPSARSQKSEIRSSFFGFIVYFHLCHFSMGSPQSYLYGTERLIRFYSSGYKPNAIRTNKFICFVMCRAGCNPLPRNLRALSFYYRAFYIAF